MELSLNKLPWYGQVVVFVVLCAAGVGAFYYFYVSPLEVDMAARQQRLDRLRVDINVGMTTATKLAEFRAEVTELERTLEALKAVLPEQKDVGELLDRIVTLATQSNLSITGFTPLATASKQLHVEWPITLQLDGTYHSLGVFFDRISKVERIINVGNITIRAKTEPTLNSTITAECTATTFVLLESAAGAAPQAAGAGG